MFEAGCAAAYIVGKAGDDLKKSYGNGFIASDFLSVLVKIITRIS